MFPPPQRSGRRSNGQLDVMYRCLQLLVWNKFHVPVIFMNQFSLTCVTSSSVATFTYENSRTTSVEKKVSWLEILRAWQSALAYHIMLPNVNLFFFLSWEFSILFELPVRGEHSSPNSTDFPTELNHFHVITNFYSEYMLICPCLRIEDPIYSLSLMSRLVP